MFGIRSPPPDRAGHAGRPSKSPTKLTTKKIKKGTSNDGRMEEAAELIAKAKESVRLSGNFKREYKKTVLETLDRLSELLAESEAELKAVKNRVDRESAGAAGLVTTVADPEPADFSGQIFSARLEEQSRLLLENNSMLKDIQTNLAKQQESIDQQKTYASVAATKPPVTKLVTTHSIAISAEDEKMTSAEVMTKLASTIKAGDGWTRVERSRRAKDRKVILGFNSIEERERVKQRIEREGRGLKVEDMKNRDPLVVLKGLYGDCTIEEVLEALKNQNPELFVDLEPGEDRVRKKYTRKTMSKEIVHLVLETSPSLWKRITERGFVYINLQKLKAQDQSPLVQCSKCLAYGHTKRFCDDTTDTCSHCSGSHLKQDCINPQEKPSCVNCGKAGLDDEHHNAFDSCCPIRKRWEEIARSSVAYS